MNQFRNTTPEGQTGFTIIELMLAMTFLSLLLLAIAMTTIQLSDTYTKGVTMREVNQVGRSVSDDFRRTIESSTPFNIAAADTLRRQPNGSGQLCLGTYSYIWNSPQSLESGAAGILTYSGSSSDPIRLARVLDKTRSYCTAVPIPSPTRQQATELLEAGDRPLVLHDFSITAGAVDSSSGQGQQLYGLSFALGTNTGDEAAISGLSACKMPGVAGDGGMQDYCSVNKFDIVVRAGGDSQGRE